MTCHTLFAIAVAMGLLLLFCGLVTGCFFTGPINNKPDARIDRIASGPTYRGEVATFSALKSDDSDRDELLVDWRAWTCRQDGNGCDSPAFQEQNRVSRSSDFTVQVPAFRVIGGAVSDQPTALILVELTVHDSRGAENKDHLFVDILNRPPELELQVQGPVAPNDQFHPIGIPVRVAARASDPDGDPVTVEWQLDSPGGSQASSWSKIGESDHNGVHEEVYQLVPDTAGTWQVEVTASDQLGARDDTDETIPVQEDAPPCIASADPVLFPQQPQARYIVERREGTRRFTVLSVTDDLDIYPPPDVADEYRGRARFRWFVATPDTAGQRVEVQNHDVSNYVIDASAYAPGDRLSLRVEVEDRVERTQCDVAQPFCALQGPSCYQRVTWELEIR
ncbi:MAG: hypothetical protein MJE77_01560 [Proteobacteria bacterium]|nr:hypothetical protein [Pseudomonadota bacterium]